MPRLSFPTGLLLTVTLMLACGACRRPEPPPTEQQPEPQATQLQKTMRESIDKAKAAEKALQDHDDRQKAALDPQG
ncbi:hypothetical protein [Luteimonas aquatica]|uniref:hypothetical protein n=1 Tax=Luteimonas aquatica TaxID=450364 RepID=UPI001F57DC93|nr:hypothetical protein [Luteimonas aquatica]